MTALERSYGKIPLIILAVFFLVSARALHAADEPAQGDAIVSAMISDANTLVPILASDAASAEVCGMLFNGLVKYDEKVAIVGDLAESWEIADGGLAIIFHLRRNVKWHDGEPFTARDVEFTYQKLIDPSVKTPYSGDFERVKSLDILDDYTLKVTYKEPFAPALSSWGMWIMPEHLLKGKDLSSTNFSRSPVGTGPYRFKKWQSGEKIELVANKDYFEGRPYIDRYIIRVIPDAATIFLELEVLGVDMASLTPLQFTRQTGNSFFKKNYNKFKYPSFSYTYIGYNLNDPKFKDIRVRKALDMAVDKEAIIDTVLFGLGRLTTGPYLLDSWAYNKEVKPNPYDPARAKELLKDAGWTDSDGDGWVDKDDKVFEFTLLVNQGNIDRERTAEMVQGYLKAVGVRMKIRVLEWNAMINEFINKRRFEAVLMGWFLARDPDNYDIWHSSKTREAEFNFIGYSNPEVDRLLVKGRQTFDQDERKVAYNKIHEIIYDEQPCTFLYSSEILPIVNSRFKNVKTSPIGIGYNFIKWYVPKSEQRYH
ncbi:MAG: peptide-binding protein [Candidatus Omnitrophica bacterium]|nr:peptide-binding protein [Candidatus Omnitrophota bacterium]